MSNQKLDRTEYPVRSSFGSPKKHPGPKRGQKDTFGVLFGVLPGSPQAPLKDRFDAKSVALISATLLGSIFACPAL